MANKERKGDNQKLKMLYLAKIFSEETDDQHSLTMLEIITKLAANGVNADRKTLYLDFEELRRFGLDIIATKVGRDCYYHLGNRDFELPELKLLVDSVQSAKFITDKKSNELIKKLEALVSKHEGKQLHRQVVISGRIKTMNESIYYNVDMLHEAINLDRQIRFRYTRWNVYKQMEYRRDGAWYQVSPWCLIWDDENYYLAAYDASEERIKHYRVDKIVELSITEEKRLGREAFGAFDPARYSRSQFGMFGGEPMRVTLSGRRDMVGTLLDRFGRDITVIPEEGGRFTAHIDVRVSRHFLAWIIALGDGVSITGPEALVEQMRAEAARLTAQYGNTNQDS